MHMSDNIKKLRLSKGWTQLELAKKLNTTQKAIATYETGVRKPSAEKIVELANILEVTTDTLLGVKKLRIKTNGQRTHKNKRSAQVQPLFDKLDPNDQRSILKQIKALTTQK